MTDIPAPAVEEVQGRIDALIRRIEDAQTLIRQHRHVDLTDLESAVERVCLDVRTPACAADQNIKDGLATLLGGLDALEQDLLTKRDVLTTGTSQAPIAPNAAASAYGKKP